MTWRTAATALLLLLTATAAQAQWRGGGRGGWGDPRSWSVAQREGGPRGGYGQRPPERGYGGPFGGYGGDGGRAEGGGYGGGGWRRGQVLPPAYRGAYVPDPGRYHLRAAPPGYGWVGDGRDAYLTQRSTGLVLDHVPGAYEPAPAWRRGGGRRYPQR